MFGSGGRPGPRAEGLDARAYLSMRFGDPWELARCRSSRSCGWATSLDFGCEPTHPRRDTIGVGTAGHVTALLGAFVAASAWP